MHKIHALGTRSNTKYPIKKCILLYIEFNQIYELKILLFYIRNILMDVLAKNIDSVLLFMSENNYKETTVTVCKKFLNSMLIYFIDNEISFSMEEAKKFLDSQNLNKIHYAICNSALKKLTNVYNGEEINGHNYP